MSLSPWENISSIVNAEFYHNYKHSPNPGAQRIGGKAPLDKVGEIGGKTRRFDVRLTERGGAVRVNQIASEVS